jgi:hypothetical protein
MSAIGGPPFSRCSADRLLNKAAENSIITPLRDLVAGAAVGVSPGLAAGETLEGRSKN